MKNIFILLLTTQLFGFSKPDKAKFYFVFSTYKHSKGMDQTVYDYRLDGNKLKVTSHWLYADSAFERLYTTTISPGTIAKLQSVNLDALGDEYINACVSATDGTEYRISAGYNNNTKKVRLYHYYKEEIAQLVMELNKSLPVEYQINYVDADTKQDCK